MTAAARNETLWQRFWRSPFTAFFIAAYFLTGLEWQTGWERLVCGFGACFAIWIFFRTGDARWGKP